MVIARYVAIGDSTTEGIGDDLPDGSQRGWADRLAGELSRRCGTLEYANLAIRGRRTAQIREEQAAAAVALDPDLITAVVGVNDLVGTSFDAQDFDAQVDALFGMLRSTGATVISATLPDLGHLVPLPPRARAAMQRRHRQLNAVLTQRAADHGVRLLPLDDLPGAVDPKVWRPDRLHPNPVGHALLAQAMLQVIDGEPVTVTATEQPGYGTTTYARPGAVPVAGWVGRYVVPRIIRRLRGKSSGDGRSAKIPGYMTVHHGVVASAPGPAAATSGGRQLVGATLGEHRQVELSAGTVEYSVAGEGPPIVFLHPLLATGLHWRNVVPPIAAAGYRCIVPTLPLGAHRIPMKPDADVSVPGVANMVTELCHELGLGPVTLVGNDTGGALAQMVAASNPGHVDRLILTSCDCFEQFFPPLFQYLKWGARVPGFAWLLGRTLRVRAVRRLPIAFGWLIKGPIPHDVIDTYAAPLINSAEIRRDLTTFLRTVSSRFTRNAAERLQGSEKPVLLLWAREDRVFAPALARRLAAMLPNASLQWIDDAYAFTPEDQPARLAEQILAFCGQTTSQ